MAGPTPSARSIRPRAATALFLALTLCLTALVFSSAPVRGGTQLEPYMTGLSWPVGLAFAPDGRIFMAERGVTGDTPRIRIIERGNLLPTPFFVMPNTPIDGEKGLLGLALDPDFATDPWVYAYHTLNDTMNATVYTRIVRIRANGDIGESLKVVLDRIPAGDFHNGGVIEFAPDKTLFAVVGENGVPANSQDLSSLNGKVLRMNRNGTVPSDNPFVGSPNANPYVYTYGHRNMFGIAWHPSTRSIFLSENGPQCNDELNLLQAGRNFGWGPNWFCGTPPTIQDTNRDGPSPVLPIASWSSTTAPTNLVVWGGSTFVRWYGDVFLGGFNTRSLLRIHLAPPTYDVVQGEEVVATGDGGVIEVEAGPDGAIWFTTPATIYRLVDTSKPPIAEFTFSPARPLIGDYVTFDGSGSTDPDFPNSTIVSYDWDFGDGAIGSGPVVTHLYASFGNYPIVLTVTDSDVLTSSTHQSIRVYASPIAAFAFSPSRPLEKTTVSFNASASSDSDGSVLTCRWVWGDGTPTQSTSSTDAQHTYASWGTYSVSLVVTDDDGFSGNTSANVRVYALPVASFVVSPLTPVSKENVSFDGSASSDPDGTIAIYEWDFGDGDVATGAAVTHVYATYGRFDVSLRVTDADAFNASAVESLAVGKPNEQPSAVFVAGANRVNPREPVAFDASNSSDPDGTIVLYAWDFGDGLTDRGVRVSHSYTSPGSYTVALTVTDNNNTHDTATGPIRVNAPPIASFSAPPTGFVGTAVAFDASLSSDPDSPITAFVWDFGDGSAGNGSFVSHAYASKRSFLVILSVTDDLGAMRSASKVVTIVNRAPVITSSEPAADTTITAGESGVFMVNATDPDGDGLSYVWRVNGSVVASGTSVYAFAPSEAGSYVVNVTASDGTAVVWRQWTVTVLAAVAPTGSESSTWVLVTPMIALIAFGLAMVWARRRGRVG